MGNASIPTTRTRRSWLALSLARYSPPQAATARQALSLLPRQQPRVTGSPTSARVPQEQVAASGLCMHGYERAAMFDNRSGGLR